MQPKCGKKTGYNVGKGKLDEDFIYLHMSNHYRKILNAKKAVDNSPPHSHKVKRPVTGNPSKNNKTRRPVENLPLTDRSISTNSNKESCWGAESYVASSSRYHVRCIPENPTYRPNLINNPLNMMLVDRIAYDTKHGPSAYCNETWLEAKPQPKDKHYKSAYDGQPKKDEPSVSTSVKRQHSATTSHDTGPKRKLAVQNRTETSGNSIPGSVPSSVPGSLEPSHCKCLRLHIRDTNEIAMKKIAHHPKEQSLTSSRDSAYNGGISSGPDSRSPTPDQRKKKECCCCCCCRCDKKQKAPVSFDQKPPPSVASSPRPPDSIDTPRIPKKEDPSSPIIPKKTDHLPPIPPKIKNPDSSPSPEHKTNSPTPNDGPPMVSFFPDKNDESIPPPNIPKISPAPSPRFLKKESIPSSLTSSYDDSMLPSSTSENNKPVPPPRTLKKSYPAPPNNTPRDNSPTSPVSYPVNPIKPVPNQSEPSPPHENNSPPLVEKDKSPVRDEESLKKLQEDSMYVTFIQNITLEVLQKNLYTNKALKKVMKKHIQNNLRNLNKDRMLKEVDNLRIQLGIPEDDSFLHFDAEGKKNMYPSKHYPLISDSEFVMPKSQSTAVSKSGTESSETMLRSVSMISDRPILTSETDEDLISVVEVTKAIRERRKETTTEETIACQNSSDDSDRPSDPKKRTVLKIRKFSRPFSSSSSDRECEAFSKDNSLGDLSLLKKNKNVSFWGNPELCRGIEIKHKKTVTRTKESIRRCENDSDSKQKCD